MDRFRRLMVWLDRPVDRGLLDYAALICRLGTVSEVRFVHILPATQEPQRQDALDELRSGVKSAFQPSAGSVSTEVEALQGPLMDTLLTYAGEYQADLLLLGVKEAPQDRRIIARRLAMKAPCSVWIIPEGSPASLQKLLVPIDFSEPSADSLQVAAGMAKLANHAECLALHVYFNEAVISYEGYDQILRGEEAEMYAKFIAPLDLQGQGVEPIFEEGPNIGQAISRVAQSRAVDTIVMATRGRSRSATILLGSVTEDLIETSRIPLLAVKHFGAHMSLLHALLDRRFWRQGSLHT